MDNNVCLKSQEILAVDFDGLLCENEYPKIGKANDKAIEYFKMRREEGDKLILWTCRKGIYLNNAIAWCRKRGLEFDAVNENLPEMVKAFHGDTRKIFANEYFDDRNVIFNRKMLKDSQKEPTGIEKWALDEIDKLLNEEDCCSEYYSCCCESAYKAFRSLVEDDHSGFSIKLTKNILNDLIDTRPLTPIDEHDKWQLSYEYEDHITAQSSRMSSLFKNVYPDGTVKYSDIDRAIGIDISDGLGYSSGIITDYINTVYPITMPYMPPKTPFKVYTETFLVDSKNGDFDTRALLYLIKPDGQKFKINQYFKETKNSWKRITKLEYLVRKARRIK
jgi:hypothetical protein